MHKESKTLTSLIGMNNSGIILNLNPCCSGSN